MPEGDWLGNMMGGLGGLGMLYGLSQLGNRPSPSVGETTEAVSYTHLTLPTTPYV